MKAVVISCSHGKHLGEKISKKLKSKHSSLEYEKFPDGELHLRFSDDVKGKNIVLVQSFYDSKEGNVQDCIVEVLFASHTAKELGASKVILAAPYFPYFRQDKRFRKGDVVSLKAMTALIGKYFDGIIVLDPHLHRQSNVKDVFRIKAEKITANKAIADFIRKKLKIKNPVLIGPDEESYKWARNVAEIIKAESYIYEKKRYSSYHVEVKLGEKAELKGRDIVVVDDIVSTGHTILETIKDIKKQKPKSISCVCVHGIFAGSILSELSKGRIKIFSTNTIPNSKSRIDVSKEFASAIMNF